MTVLQELESSCRGVEAGKSTASVPNRATASVAPEDITVTGFLGSGKFAQVYRGTFKSKPVALKVVPTAAHDADAQFAIQSFIHEATLMQAVHHRCGGGNFWTLGSAACVAVAQH